MDFIPILAHFCFANDLIYAYNDKTAIVVAKETGLDCAVRGSVLLDLLNTAGDEIELEQGDNELTITDSKNKMRVPILPAADFLFEMPDDGDLQSVAITDKLIKGLELCAMAAGLDALQPAMTGVTIQSAGKKIALYSTDNRTITRYLLPQKIDERIQTIIVHKQACEQLVKLYGSVQTSVKSKELLFADDHVTAHFVALNDVSLVAKLVQADPLDYDDLFKNYTTDVELTAIPEELVTVLKRTVTFQGNELQKSIKFRLSGRKLNYEAKGPYGDHGGNITLEDNLDTELTFEVDPVLLLRMVEHATEIGFGEGAVVLEGEGLTHLVCHLAS